MSSTETDIAQSADIAEMKALIASQQALLDAAIAKIEDQSEELDAIDEQLNPTEPDPVAEDCPVCNLISECPQCGNPVIDTNHGLRAPEGTVNKMPLPEIPVHDHHHGELI